MTTVDGRRGVGVLTGGPSALIAVPLGERLAAMASSQQSSYLVLRHKSGGVRASSIDTPPQTPCSLPVSPRPVDSMASYALDANTILTDCGTLEDGGLEGLRQSLTPDEVQYVFLKFKGEMVFVQYIPEAVSAVYRARSMVVGRSLMAHLKSCAPFSITIANPRQLTDPLIRARMGSCRTATRSDARSAGATPFPASPVTPNSPFSPADVPMSVSMPTLSPQSLTMSNGSDRTLTQKGNARMHESSSLSVGLGIGSLDGDNPGGVFTPFADLCESVETGNAGREAAPQRSDRSPASLRRPSAVSTNSALRAFPIPPIRTMLSSSKASTLSQQSANRRQHKEGQRGDSKAENGRSETPPRSLTHHPSMPSLHRSGFVTSMPALPSPRQASFPASSISASSAVLYYLKGIRNLHDDEEDGQYGVGQSSLEVDVQSSYSSIADEEHVRQQKLEHERIEFLRWRAEQAEMIAAKEKKQERARRRADEAQRDRVMRKLWSEQSDTRTRTSLSASTDGRSILSTPLPSLPPLNLPSDRGSQASASSARGYALQSKRSREAISLPPLEPPNAPLPSLPGSRPSVRAGMSLPPRSARVSDPPQGGSVSGMNGFAKESSENPDRRPAFSTLSSVPPLAERVQAAIEREMRRPVITLEGHVRPLVSRARAKSLVTSWAEEDARSKAEMSPPPPPLPSSLLGKGGPLMQAVLEARRFDGQESIPSDGLVVTGLPSEPPTPFSKTSRPAPLKIVQPDGIPIGAGWAVSTADVQKSLPATPLSSAGSTERLVVRTSSGLHDDDGQTQESTWNSLLDFINNNNRTITPSRRSDGAVPDDEEEKDTLVSSTTGTENAVTLIDQVFRFAILTSMSKRAGMKRLEAGTDAAQQIRALQERQDVLEQMLIELQRRRTVRSKSESRFQERWRRQTLVRESLAEDVRKAMEQEEEQRRVSAALEQAEEEENARIITLIMYGDGIQGGG